MNAGEIADLVVAVVAALGALTAYLKVRTTQSQLASHIDTAHNAASQASGREDYKPQ